MSALLVLLGLAGAAFGSFEGRLPAQEAEGRAGKGYGCPPETRYLTLTSTKVLPSTVYATSIHLVPTTLVQDVTEWRLKTSAALVLTQTVTSYPDPRIITNTQSLTATRYVTRVQHLTETEYVTVTEPRSVTDAVVATESVTRTRPVTAFRTSTVVVTTSTRRLLQTRVSTTTLCQVATVSESAPNYVATTQTSYYRVYDAATVTRTEDEYVTSTSLVVETRTVTRCSPVYPASFQGY